MTKRASLKNGNVELTRKKILKYFNDFNNILKTYQEQLNNMHFITMQQGKILQATVMILEDKGYITQEEFKDANKRGEPAGGEAPLVQRAHSQLHHDDPASRSGGGAREPLELEDPRERLPGRTRLLAWYDRYEPAVLRTQGEEQHHSRRECGRSGS